MRYAVSNVANNYWTEKEIRDLEKAQSFKDLHVVARVVLDRMPRPRVQVCGPISTGGVGSVKGNLKRFDTFTGKLEQEGVEVFNQIAFQEPIERILAMESNGGYPMHLLEDFYLPIFENLLVDELHFLPDWESSIGSRWEHEQAKRLGLKVVYLE